MSEQETLVSKVLAEVLAVDHVKQQVRVRIQRPDDLILEATYEIDSCPEPARQVGASFYIQTTKTGSGCIIVRSLTVDAEEDKAVLAELLDD